MSGVVIRPMRHCRSEQTFQSGFAGLGSSHHVMLNTSNAIRSTSAEDGRVLLDVHHGQMFSVNVVGSKILELIELGWDEPAIVVEISQRFATRIDVVTADVRDFIEALRKHKILVTTNSTEPMHRAK